MVVALRIWLVLFLVGERARGMALCIRHHSFAVGQGFAAPSQVRAIRRAPPHRIDWWEWAPEMKGNHAQQHQSGCVRQNGLTPTVADAWLLAIEDSSSSRSTQNRPAQPV